MPGTLNYKYINVILTNSGTNSWQCIIVFIMSRYVKPIIVIQMFILMFPCVVNGKFSTLETKDVYNYHYVSLLVTDYTNQPTDMILLHVLLLGNIHIVAGG